MNPSIRASVAATATLLALTVAAILLWQAGDPATEFPLLHAGGAAILLALVVLMVFFAARGWVKYRESRRVGASALRALAAGDEARARAMLSRRRGELAGAIREAIAAVDRLRSEAEENQLALARLLNALGEGVLAIDSRRRIARVNDAALELFDVRDRNSCEGRPFIEIVRNQALASAFDRALGSGEEVRAQAVVESHGLQRQIELRVFPVNDSPVIAAVALFIDVTQLERLQRIRRDFIADFSHEVRTPLAGLRLALESLEGGALEAAQSDQLFRIIGRQIYRLERLVSDLSQLNEIESGEAVLQYERTDLRTLLEDLCDEFRKKAAAHGIEIALSGDHVSVWVDAVKIQQVFSNLIDNAIRHSGEIRRIEVSVLTEEDQAVVRVRDFGAGIPADEQPRIFHRFYRVEKSRTAGRGSGTGLGLAIAKHLVLRHQGRIGVESEPGAGATFWVSLPLDRRESARAGSSS